MGWSMFFVYLGSYSAGLTFVYYFYKAKYSLHQTEILMLESFRRLPLYWPPAPPTGETNSRTDAEGVPDDVKVAFSEWFVITDLEEPGGVTRDDVLELINDLGYSDQAQPAKDFLYRGEGHIEERRRMTCVGLQESLALVSTLRADAAIKLAKAPEEGAAPPLEPKSDAQAVEILRRKFRRSASVLSGAEVLRQANVVPATVAAGSGSAAAPSEAAASSLSTASAASPAAPLAPLEDSGDMDEDEHLRLEDRRLARLEEELLAKLERLGALSPAEESRLLDVREKRSAMKAS